jgi:hypothetical protein
MSVRLARNFDTITYEPLGEAAIYSPDANNSLRSFGFTSEGGTIRQSYFINSISAAPFNIEHLHVYQPDVNYYSTNIQVFGSFKLPFVTPLGTPRMRFYLCSPSTSSRVATVEQDGNGDDILVYHLTLDEYINDTYNAIDSLHADGPGVNYGTHKLDNFLQAFDVICNIGTYSLAGALTYYNLYYNDPNNASQRHKYDILAYVELPQNNINTFTSDYTIDVSESTLPL